ncbi:MAG: hypothetical protein COA49_03660 [Bacteroidetes bacterium]|nr:MAG: hypothetical protein COA49_03660 [Bacteroidota bacterium]
MKYLLKETRLWIVVMTLLVSSSVIAQDVPYTPFNFEGNPVWTDNALVPIFNFDLRSSVYWMTQGVELIDSISYFNLFAKEVGIGTQEDFDHVGYIRESENRKVYFIPLDEEWYMYGICDLNAGQEYIIYDFNINIGDTLGSLISQEFIVTPDQTDYVILDSIILVQVDVNYRKAYYFSDNTGELWMWIEGIGGDRGLIRPIYPYYLEGVCNPYAPIGPVTNVLTCYNDDDIYYQNSYLDIWWGTLNYNPEEGLLIDDNCNLILSKDELTVDNNRVRISPNPNEGGFSITIPESARLPIEMYLYDIQGSQIFNLELTSISASLNLSHLTPGVYFLEGEGLKPTKIVIQ